jgi:chromosome segregation protein
LLEKIGPLKVQSAADRGLRELSTEISREEKTLSEAETILESLETLGEAGSLILSKKELESSPLASIVTKLEAVASERTEDQANLEELTLTQSRLIRLGFSETELNNLINRAEDLGLTEAVLLKPSAVEREGTKRRKRIADLSKKLLTFQKEQKQNDRQARQIQKQSLGEGEFYDPNVDIERRLTIVKEAQAAAARIERSISIHVTDDFAQVRRRLSTFSDTLQRVQQALKRVEERDVLEKRLQENIKENGREISSVQPRQERAKQALDLINRLLASENKEQYIADTVNEHHEKLSTLFCKIHAPNEFEAVELNGELLLKRNTGEKSNVSEISTGQRAALALSIFLAMNSSVSSRAPWLLFDDPIAHVDDLNILSFFDTLRDLLLLGNQQIFFATASSRIADLFVRKFDFLGTEGLKQFPLDRPH